MEQQFDAAQFKADFSRLSPEVARVISTLVTHSADSNASVTELFRQLCGVINDICVILTGLEDEIAELKGSSE